ncbi:sigma-54 dependent transcriptional regulator [Aliivibrio sp. S4TY2]|uniref:sigma-54-dependent transcriptional regulator n=1 Tax=unclassified Aliivibrio TaxID=2645654 RepID=UPI002378F38D|nr:MULTISPECIES: sigma-54 dependent transcriptional regulator [unclassified Aliivibrio]MDD9157290.1 sigma-54 dependent transcriptional regulator [Aliivibrio sp. S4TY2]MDD9161172.1 sigma-54 dependent transcriptional regulator [Aliivibrio sp. S4TY1]MDD9165202.1 sigma-54 dependent transcriptional regulator [Aliivibrio sp. S4MY2]MDD9169200.1 sigma-54 dependent transcriptional regulator [Aliivibrio sp. S4MY4]MDD9185977.1 sigma-54 dependent transcriptional regulator [Aliivibrio sp. S4MY3]
MGTQFRMDSVPGSLVVVGGSYEPWLAVLEQVGWRCHRCYDLRAAQALFDEIGPCIGIVDLSQDDFSLNGIATLVNNNKQVRWMAFIRESQLSSDTICQFIVNFCIDFFTAPIPDAQLLSTIGHQLGMLKLERKVWPNMGQKSDLGILGEAPAVKRLRDQIRRVAPTDVSILISGESGVGKDAVAKAVHDSSGRNKGPFISLNCGSLSDSKIEQELFGQDLSDYQESKLFQASGGTLFLNDINDLPAAQQQHLLRFLQEGNIETTQGFIDIDVRVIVASHIDLEKAIEEGNFKEELYYRLNVLRIHVPSLKERSSDISVLADHFLQRYAREYNTQARTFSEDAMQTMLHYQWPGNVRELVNQVKRAVLLADSMTIDLEHLDLPQRSDTKRSLRVIRENSERDALLMVLESHDGQVSSAAKELGVSRATMYRLLNKHNLISEPRSYS